MTSKNENQVICVDIVKIKVQKGIGKKYSSIGVILTHSELENCVVSNHECSSTHETMDVHTVSSRLVSVSDEVDNLYIYKIMSHYLAVAIENTSSVPSKSRSGFKFIIINDIFFCIFVYFLKNHTCCHHHTRLFPTPSTSERSMW